MSRAPTPLPVQSDLFVADAMKGRQQYRSDRLLMQLPLFSLNRRPSFDEKRDRWKDGDREYYVRVTPSHEGLATQWDFDILAYLQTVIVDALNRGQPVSNSISFSIHDCLKFLQRGTSGREYENFHASLRRLQGTIVYTNVKAGDRIIDGGFGWLQKFSMSRRELPGGRTIMESCEITLCDWLFNTLVEDRRFLKFDQEYFTLDSGLERKLFLIISSHLGNDDAWHVGLDRLREKTGSIVRQSKFNYEIRQVVERDDFQQWRLFLTTDSRGPAFGGKIVAPELNVRAPVYLYVYRRRFKAGPQRGLALPGV